MGILGTIKETYERVDTLLDNEYLFPKGKAKRKKLNQRDRNKLWNDTFGHIVQSAERTKSAVISLLSDISNHYSKVELT
jgi:hypothetical protein